MERRQIGVLALLGGALALLVLLSAGLHDVVLQPGRPVADTLAPFGGAPGTQGRLEIPPWLPALAAVGLVIGAIAFIVSPALRRDLLRNMPAYLLLLLGVWLLSQSVSEQPARQGPAAAPPPAAEAPPADIPSAPEVISDPPEWLVGATTALLIAAIAAAGFVVVRRMRLRRAPSEMDQLLDEARGALESLRSGADLRDTITRCYAEMVRVLSERRGVGRDATLTPRELELRLASAGLADSHIRRLTRLFELVRYSPRRPGPPEEREAEECLRAIVEAYGPDSTR